MKLTVPNTENPPSLSIPLSRQIFFELPFWLIFAFWSLYPDLRTPKFEILSIPVSSKDIAIVVTTCIYIFWPGISQHKEHSLTKPWNWHHHLPILTTVVLVYGMTSLYKLETSNAYAMGYTLILTLASFFLGYLLIAKQPVARIRPFLWRLTVMLAALGLLYSAASFLSLGLGEVRQSLNSQDQEFGIVRVAGPLFVAAKGFFILIPALAFAIQECIQSPGNRLFKLAIVFILTLTIIGLGSRAGLLILGAFFLLIILLMQDKKQAAIAGSLMLILTLIAVVLVFSRANPERIQSLEDISRQETYQTSFQIIANRGLDLNLFGSGYGSYWPWYLLDATGDYRLPGQGFYLLHPFGYMLYHPHSTLLMMVVELGLLGLSYFLYFWKILFQLILKNLQKHENFLIFSCGLFASGLSMFFDFFLFKDATTNVLWWIFLFGLISLSSTERNEDNIMPSF
jgi:O-antigen ligase